jgi:spore photoproduct lyase
MSKIETPTVTSGITDEQLEDIVRNAGWRESRRLSGNKKAEDPVVIFNSFDFSLPDGDQAQGRGDIFTGGRAWALRDRKRVLKAGTVCQTAWEIHTVRGCLFKCDYCYLQNVLNIMVNIEVFIDRFRDFVNAHSQTLYKWDSHSDILPFEPEYNASKPMVEFFGTQNKAFLMHYTKSDNVDCLEGLKHNGQTMVCWSLSGHTQSRLIEKDTATDEARIEAMRKCRAWGYHVRCRFSPVIPVKGWREENRALVERLFSKVQPDVISLQSLSRFPEYDMVPRLLDLDLLDPSFVGAAQRAKSEMEGRIVGPFPHEKRLEIYRFLLDEIKRISPQTPVSLCLESPEMWQDLGPIMGISPNAYPCCCGGLCTPGQPIMAG